MVELTTAQLDLRERIHDLAERKIAPRAAEVDRTEEYPWDNVEALTGYTWAIRQALESQGITGDDGGDIGAEQAFCRHAPWIEAPCRPRFFRSRQASCQIAVLGRGPRRQACRRRTSSGQAAAPRWCRLGGVGQAAPSRSR